MGNYGNTVDRWYRRGAVLLWPKAKAFAVRAEAEPVWALASISTRVRAGELDAPRVICGIAESPIAHGTGPESPPCGQ